MFHRQRFLLLTKTANSRVLIHTTTKDTLTPRNSKLLTNWTGAKSIILKFFSKGEKYKFLGLIPMERHLVTVDPDGRLFLLGTDINGRDIFSRILFGGRISLTIGFLALFYFVSSWNALTEGFSG